MADIMEEEAAAAKVKSIFIYPVKSCRGISVSQASISSTGTASTIWDSSSRISVGSTMIPVVEPHEKANAVSVWEWSGSAFDEGEEASKWFTDFLGKPCRLVRFDEESETRPVDREYARNYKVKFNDLYQFLILSQGSLDALNDRLEQPVLVNRFRPNILVDGCESFAEDFWREIKINDSTFLGHDLCHRCKVKCGPNHLHLALLFLGLAPGKDAGLQDLIRPEQLKAIRVGDFVHVLKAVDSYSECIM